MDVKIVACMPCYPRRRTAMKLAKTINEELGIDVPIESGQHGQLDVAVDGVFLVIAPHLINEDKHYPLLARTVVNELRRRLQPQPA